MRYAAMVEGERIEIDLETTETSRVEAVIGTRRYRCELAEVEPGLFWLVHEGRSIEIAVTPEADGYAVRIDSRGLRVQLMDRRRRLRASMPGAGTEVVEVRALMPGRVVQVLVEAGARVERGQGLCVIEAMKMQNETPSPRAGRIGRLLAREGAAVNAGDLLATIGPDEDEQ